MFARVTFSALTISLATSALMTSKASAHSDYWRCAASAGSAENVQAQCGSRSDYDRTGELGGANTPTEAQRQARRDQEERQRQDEIRREDDRRRDANRRDEEDRRRRDDDRRREIEREEEESRRRRNDDSYDRSTRQPRTSPRQRNRQAEAPVSYEDTYVPVAVNRRAPTLNLGSVMNVAGNRGLRVKAISVETSTPGGSRVSVVAGGVRVGSIIAQQPGEYEKSFVVPRKLAKAGSRLTLVSQGDVTVLRVTLLVGR